MTGVPSQPGLARHSAFVFLLKSEFVNRCSEVGEIGGIGGIGESCEIGGIGERILGDCNLPQNKNLKEKRSFFEKFFSKFLSEKIRKIS